MNNIATALLKVAAELAELNKKVDHLIKIEDSRLGQTSRGRVAKIKKSGVFTPMQIRVLGFIYEHQNEMAAISSDLYAKMQEANPKLYPKSLSTLRPYLSILYSTGALEYLTDGEHPYWRVNTDIQWVSNQIRQYRENIIQQGSNDEGS